MKSSAKILFSIISAVFAINAIYCFAMYVKCGGVVPILFRSRENNIKDNIWLRRRGYGLEFWLSFIGLTISLFMVINSKKKLKK